MFLKKSQVKLLMYLFIATLSFMIILGLYKMVLSKAPDKASEDICFITNAYRTELKIAPGGKEIVGLPGGCKKIEKTIPSDLYDQTEKGAKEELRRMISKCWWMWLEGRDPEVMDSNWIFGPNRCFICYQFDLDKKISFSATEFDTELFDKIYDVEDASHQCAGLLGGYCVNKKSDPKVVDEKISKNYKIVKTGKCEKEGEVCVLHKKNKCENKGGECKGRYAGDDMRLYADPSWSCGDGDCYLYKANVLTYYKYVEQFGGKGKMLIDKKINFDSNGVYAVTFIHKTSNLMKETLEKLEIGYEQEPDASAIYVSKLGDVNNKCHIEVGVDGGLLG